jgi:hypothetical protein
VVWLDQRETKEIPAVPLVQKEIREIKGIRETPVRRG